jgi:hypothetical protein
MTQEAIMITLAGMISEIAATYPHVVMERVGNRDGYTKAKNSMRQAERVDIPVAQKEHACSDSPDKGYGCQDRIR